MIPQVAFALAHPVYDPLTQIVPGHYWRTKHFGHCLTVNIGME
jgi:hypothetical protein